MFIVAIVALMIGVQVTSDLIAQFRYVWMSFIGVTLFVPLAFGVNYLIYRNMGRFNFVAAFYSAASGGLMESIAFGEDAGCDIKTLTTQQFLRIIVVIVLVSTFISLWLVNPSLAAGGESIASNGTFLSTATIVVSFIAALGGLYLGRLFRLPAGQLTDPLFIAAIINVSGIAIIALPKIILIISQIVIRACLGSRFAGLTGKMLIKAMVLSILSVCAMLIIGITISLSPMRLNKPSLMFF